ncbi:MAG: hypothetical protein H6Q77_1453 [Gemmatimonadetes bacterium]|nr:hypothetical protein [Gemmatimonadota bacterium]
MRRCTAAILTALLAGCVQQVLPKTAPVPALPADSVVASLFFISDGGRPDPDGEPVLQALTAGLMRAPERSVAFFLGDNVYYSGIPDSTSPDYAEARRRLTAQVGAVVASGARGVFLPGNHDWKGPEGWSAVLRAEAIVAEEGAGRVVQLPGNGCPGPATMDIGPVRLVMIDTEWWLHKTGPRPEGTEDGCTGDEHAVFDSLRTLLATAGGRQTLVAGHHPLAAGGEHAGYFSWKDYFFPLRHLRSWLWLPLPVIGAAYPAARNAGISRQDMSNKTYGRLIDSLESVFRDVPPAAYIAGHEHSLQVIEMPSGLYQLVSGGGYYGHIDFVGPIDGTWLALARSGFMRVDVTPDGRLRLGVLTVDRAGHAREAASMWLTRP